MAQVLGGMQAGRQQAETGAQGAARTGQTISSLAATIRDSSGAAREIATVAQQQDRGIEETLKAMNGIFLSVQEAVSQTARVAAQARALSDLAAELKAQVHGQ
jgi:methyl-accepting chemotaxis protein